MEKTVEELFGPFNLEAMNETDVGQILIRPLLHHLGYRQGTPNNITTEKRLHYSHAYLGHKKKTDPTVKGRADYICEVTSFGRWVIEAKAPNQELTLEDAYQAHTYAAHPEIRAVFTMLTNGREFRVYRVGGPDKPIFQWRIEDTGLYFMNIRNLLGPAAIRSRVEVFSDYGKPLALGFGSKIEIVGGQLTYEKHTSPSPHLMQVSDMDNLKAAIVGGKVERLEGGHIQGEVKQAGPYSQIPQLDQLLGVDTLNFSTADEYISTNREEPTIFQNVVFSVPVGTPLPKAPGMSSALPFKDLPLSLSIVASTEAVGYIEGDRFRGTFSIDYEITYSDSKIPGLIAALPPKLEIAGIGTFEVIIKDMASQAEGAHGNP